MTKEGFFINYIKQIERSDSILGHSTFVIRYSAVQINSRWIGSLDAEVYLTPYLTALSDQYRS